MSAKVSKKFDKKFELNEESIRRIHSDIRKRVPEDKHKEIIFEIFREDSLVYQTSEIDRVLSENNDSTQKIKSIKIGYLDESLNIELIFDSVDGAKLTVVGEDRDTVYLISSELKEYIQKEVAFLFGGNLQSRNILCWSNFYCHVHTSVDISKQLLPRKRNDTNDSCTGKYRLKRKDEIYNKQYD
jgi:hypothetical protein